MTVPSPGVTAERSHPLRLLPARCSASLPSPPASLLSPIKIFQLFPPSRQQLLCVFSVGEQQLRLAVLEQQQLHPAPRAVVMLMMPWALSQVSLSPDPPLTQRLKSTQYRGRRDGEQQPQPRYPLSSSPWKANAAGIVRQLN